MYKDFEHKDPRSGELVSKDNDLQFVVLMKELHSLKWIPVHHAKELDAELSFEMDPKKKVPMYDRPIFDSTFGAINYIIYHQQCAPAGTQYKIKNRKGEVVA